MRYMLDTNICIYAIKHKPEQVFIRLKEHDPQELCISSGTYAELVHGVEKSKATEKNRVALALLLANTDIVSFDSLAAQSYGKIRADLEKAGTPPPFWPKSSHWCGNSRPSPTRTSCFISAEAFTNCAVQS